MTRSDFLAVATRARIFELTRYLNARVLVLELLQEAATGIYVLPARMLGGGDA